MRRQHRAPWHLNEIAIGFFAVMLRLAALFVVFGAGYAVYAWFGLKWFYVFIFACMAARLHLEIMWIERLYEKREEENRNSPRENPFRKR